MQYTLDFNISNREIIIHEVLAKISQKRKCKTATEYIRKLLTTEQLRREHEFIS